MASPLALRLARIAEPTVAGALVGDDPSAVVEAGLTPPWRGADLVRVVRGLPVRQAEQVARRAVCPDGLVSLTGRSRRKAVRLAAVRNPYLPVEHRISLFTDRDREVAVTAMVATPTDHVLAALPHWPQPWSGHRKIASAVAAALATHRVVDAALVAVVRHHDIAETFWRRLQCGDARLADDVTPAELARALRALLRGRLPRLSKHLVPMRDHARDVVVAATLACDDVDQWRQVASYDDPEVVARLAAHLLDHGGPLTAAQLLAASADPERKREPGMAEATVDAYLRAQFPLRAPAVAALLQALDPDQVRRLPRAARTVTWSFTDDGLLFTLTSPLTAAVPELHRKAVTAAGNQHRQRLVVAAHAPVGLLPSTVGSVEELEVLALRGLSGRELAARAWSALPGDRLGPIARGRLLAGAVAPLAVVPAASLTPAEHSAVVARLDADDGIDVAATWQGLVDSPHADVDDVLAACAASREVLARWLFGILPTVPTGERIARLSQVHDDLDKAVWSLLDDREYRTHALPGLPWADELFGRLTPRALWPDELVTWLHAAAAARFGSDAASWRTLVELAGSWDEPFDALLDTVGLLAGT